MTPALEQAAMLHAIGEHLQRRPHLAPVVVWDDDLQIDHQRRDKARALLEWATTIDANDLRVKLIDNHAHVHALGRLVSGQAVDVWAVVDGFAAYLGVHESTTVSRYRLAKFVTQHGGGEDR